MTAKTVAVILLSFLSVAYGQPFQTKNIEGNSGLYFEDAGKVVFYDQEWKIVSSINLTEYRIELSNIRRVVDAIKIHCEELYLIKVKKNASLQDNDECGPALLKLNFVMADIDENDSHWLDKNEQTKRKSFSRWTINQHSMFFSEFSIMSAHGTGTSTSTDSQISYIMSMLNSVGKLSESKTSINAYVTSQLSRIHTTLIAAQNGSINPIKLFQLRTTIPEVISYQLLILNNFASKQKQYLNIMSLVGAKNARIPTMLSTPILLNELNNIRNIASEKGLDFPEQLTSENVHFLLQLSFPEISLFRDQIFITFNFPLISKLSRNYFTLFKVTSALRNLYGSIYSFVIPNHEFIAVDAHKDRYITLTVDEFNKCRQVGNETVTLCKQISPLNIVSTSSECEIMILLKHQYQARKCNERYISNYANIFIRVLQPNSWLATMTSRSKVRYLCEGKYAYEIVTQINGLFTIDPKCTFLAGDAVITGHNSYPKGLVREHVMEKLKREELLSESSIESSSKYPKSNRYAQVIEFGESKKLLHISSSFIEVDTFFRTKYGEERVARIVGITSGSLIAVTLVFLIILWCCEKKRMRDSNAKTNGPVEPLPYTQDLIAKQI